MLKLKKIETVMLLNYKYCINKEQTVKKNFDQNKDSKVFYFKVNQKKMLYQFK